MFFSLVLMHYLNFKDTDAKKRAGADIIFYVLMAIWYVGIIGHYAAVSKN